MTVGLIAVVAALGAATVLGVITRRRAGRFRSAREGSDGTHLSPADIGEPLGERATLVQFSSAFCAPCRGTRQVLSHVAGMVDGVRHVEIDAADRMDLVGRLRISATPTVFVLGPDGAVVKRATGLPRTADVIAAVGAATPAQGRAS